MNQSTGRRSGHPTRGPRRMVQFQQRVEAIRYGQRSWDYLLPYFIRSRLNYYRFHFSYIVTVGLVGSLLLYILEYSHSGFDLPFVDALFIAFSAVTCTGLISVDFPYMRDGSKFVVFLMIQAGNIVGLSTIPLLYKYFFLRNQVKIIKRNIVRRGFFHDEDKLALNNEERRIVEFAATKKLLTVCFMFVLSFYIVVFCAMYGYFLVSSSARDAIHDHGAGSPNPAWWALFHTVSAFSNAGFSLFSGNLVPFAEQPWILICTMGLISAGNTAYPLLLRFIIVFMRTTATRPDRTPLSYLLRHSRESFTHLFSANQTRTLFLAWLVMNSLQFFLFLSFEWGGVLSEFGFGNKIIVGLFQSVTTRTAGFNCIPMRDLQAGMQVLTVVFMYIAAYPFVLTLHDSSQIRRKAIVLDRLYTEELPDSGHSVAKQAQAQANRLREIRKNTLGKTLNYHLQNVFLSDGMWLVLAWFVISAANSASATTDVSFSPFVILFEIVSAYGTVGLSLGFPGRVPSFATVVGPVSKLMLIVVMVMGKHRGLPHKLDVAIQVNPDAGANYALLDKGTARFGRRFRGRSRGRLRLQDRRGDDEDSETSVGEDGTEELGLDEIDEYDELDELGNRAKRSMHDYFRARSGDGVWDAIDEEFSEYAAPRGGSNREGLHQRRSLELAESGKVREIRAQSDDESSVTGSGMSSWSADAVSGATTTLQRGRVQARRSIEKGALSTIQRAGGAIRMASQVFRVSSVGTPQLPQQRTVDPTPGVHPRDDDTIPEEIELPDAALLAAAGITEEQGEPEMSEEQRFDHFKEAVATFDRVLLEEENQEQNHNRLGKKEWDARAVSAHVEALRVAEAGDSGSGTELVLPLMVPLDPDVAAALDQADQDELKEEQPPSQPRHRHRRTLSRSAVVKETLTVDTDDQRSASTMTRPHPHTLTEFTINRLQHSLLALPSKAWLTVHDTGIPVPPPPPSLAEMFRSRSFDQLPQPEAEMFASAADSRKGAGVSPAARNLPAEGRPSRDRDRMHHRSGSSGDGTRTGANASGTQELHPQHSLTLPNLEEFRKEHPRAPRPLHSGRRPPRGSHDIQKVPRQGQSPPVQVPAADRRRQTDAPVIVVEKHPGGNQEGAAAPADARKDRGGVLGVLHGLKRLVRPEKSNGEPPPPPPAPHVRSGRTARYAQHQGEWFAFYDSVFGANTHSRHTSTTQTLPANIGTFAARRDKSADKDARSGSGSASAAGRRTRPSGEADETKGGKSLHDIFVPPQHVSPLGSEVDEGEESERSSIVSTSTTTTSRSSEEEDIV